MECMPRPCVLPVEAVLWGWSLNNSQKTVLRENLYITGDKARLGTERQMTERQIPRGQQVGSAPLCDCDLMTERKI